LVQVDGPGGWSLDLGAEFQLIDNGDSIQAAAGDRVLYLSAMRVATATSLPSVAQLRATASGSLRSTERLSHRGFAVEGEAEIRRDADSFALHGFMCADGSVATCVINFGQPTDAAWAESVWRSLTRDAS
jgi:hypothetical protein